jgi:hypothetical protein
VSGIGRPQGVIVKVVEILVAGSHNDARVFVTLVGSKLGEYTPVDLERHDCGVDVPSFSAFNVPSCSVIVQSLDSDKG